MFIFVNKPVSGLTERCGTCIQHVHLGRRRCQSVFKGKVSCPTKGLGNTNEGIQKKGSEQEIENKNKKNKKNNESRAPLRALSQDPLTGRQNR